MDKSNVIYLISAEYETDAYGILQPTHTEHKVYCNVASVSQREFFDGGRNGLNPEYKFTMFAYDYSGEELVEFNDIVYRVYRTYRTNTDEIELYVQRKYGENVVIADG